MIFKKINSSSTIFIFFWTLGSTRIFRREGKRLSWLFLHWRVASLGKKILSPVAFPLLSEVGLKTRRWRDVSVLRTKLKENIGVEIHFKAIIVYTVVLSSLTALFAPQGNPGEDGVDGLDGEQVWRVSHSMFPPLPGWHSYCLLVDFTISLDTFTCMLNNVCS